VAIVQYLCIEVHHAYGLRVVSCAMVPVVEVEGLSKPLKLTLNDLQTKFDKVHHHAPRPFTP
jgi:hypothetical protein